jgi:hypothetical protein
MRIRTRIITFVIAGAIACGGLSASALAATHSTGCSSSKSSAASAYGGQGTQITQLGCEPKSSTPPSEPTASSALPFTGLDIGLLVAAGAVLVAAGLTLRWRLRHGER